MLIFARRNLKEMLRDPLNLAFGLGFPIVVLLLLTAIQANIPVPMFELGQLTPGISVFGLSFISLFSATLVARDRSGALLMRLYTTPLRPVDFILGYTLPLIPLSVAQTVICYLCAMILGLPCSGGIFCALLASVPASLVFIGIGLLCGSVLTDKQAGGICGALLTNLTAWLSGTWFDLNLVGGAFRKAADCLPFVHAVELQRAALNGDVFLQHLIWVCAYALLMLAAAVLLFLRQMRRQ